MDRVCAVHYSHRACDPEQQASLAFNALIAMVQVEVQDLTDTLLGSYRHSTAKQSLCSDVLHYP